MSVSDVLDAMKEFAKQYSALIGLAGALGLGELIRAFVRRLRGADVRVENQKLQAENQTLQAENQNLKTESQNLKGETKVEQILKAENQKLQAENQNLKTENQNLKDETKVEQILKAENQKLQNAFNGVRALFTDDNNNLWLRGPVIKPDGYDRKLKNSIPILLVANLKGGVGKTTTSAYLASYFERQKGEKVLAIDLDQQGSLCSMLSPESQLRSGKRADGVKDIISGRAADSLSLSQSVAIRNTTRDSRLIECDDSFGNFEMQVLLEWLIGDFKGDIRYNLARVLHSPAVQGQFNRVIIDAPPRITTGLVNALCASTYLVVPFVLDILSAERVGLFLRNIKDMRGELFPHLDLACVVGTLKGDSTSTLRDAERDAIEEAEKGVLANWGPGEYVRRDVLIPRKQAIAAMAGIGVAKNIDCFDRLGERLYTLTGGVKRPSAA